MTHDPNDFREVEECPNCQVLHDEINEQDDRIKKLETEAKLGNIPYREAIALKDRIKELEAANEKGFVHQIALEAKLKIAEDALDKCNPCSVCYKTGKCEIEIKNRWDGKIIVSGDYESIKSACIENKAYLRGADFRWASLEGAYLRGGNLDGADLKGASLGGAYLDGANLKGANLDGANLKGANLDGANLKGANLKGANLDGANLDGADLKGARNYAQSHDIFIEVCKRERKTFTEKDWAMIGVISVCRICWGEIKKKFKHDINRVFKKLSNAGFDEWEKYYKEI